MLLGRSLLCKLHVSISSLPGSDLTACLSNAPRGMVAFLKTTLPRAPPTPAPSILALPCRLECLGLRLGSRLKPLLTNLITLILLRGRLLRH